jgi:hypothetical protein
LISTKIKALSHQVFCRPGDFSVLALEGVRYPATGNFTSINVLSGALSMCSLRVEAGRVLHVLQAMAGIGLHGRSVKPRPLSRIDRIT